MKSYREIIKPTVDMIEWDRVRIILEVETIEVGVLYFERAKKGWTNKPLTNGWTCVDAKVEGLYIYGGESATPKDIIAWCQELINKHPQEPNDNNNQEQEKP